MLDGPSILNSLGRLSMEDLGRLTEVEAAAPAIHCLILAENGLACCSGSAKFRARVSADPPDCLPSWFRPPGEGRPA